MKVIFDQRIQHDLRTALTHYDAEGGPALGDRFFAAVEHTIAKVIAPPADLSFCRPWPPAGYFGVLSLPFSLRSKTRHHPLSGAEARQAAPLLRIAAAELTAACPE
jgi:hypothetical protein